MNEQPIAVALTGASGIAYGMRLIECLLQAGRQVQLLYSQAAQIVAAMELNLQIPASAEQAQRQLTVH
ncbi:MAG TPA: aromatic acid decarboxylase, partial [Thiolapillus brandeum]|nr:aromatic acid decarboxylase [Thiolapillus brandeum]